jgi:hypothetical protein
MGKESYQCKTGEEIRMNTRHIIEFLECGVWDTLDEADNREDALLLASHYADLLGEERIRISRPDNDIL